MVVTIVMVTAYCYGRGTHIYPRRKGSFLEIFQYGGASAALGHCPTRKPAKFEVLLTEGVEQDLEAIHDYISEFDCVANANYVLDAVYLIADGRRDMQIVLARRLLGA